MLSRFSYILLLFAFHFYGLNAQIPIPSPSKAGKVDDKVFINSEKDQKRFDKYLQKWGQPQTLFLGKNINGSQFFKDYPFMDELGQVVFLGSNQLNADLLCELTGLEHAIFHVAEFDSALLAAINNCPFLLEISFYFQQDVPVDSRWFQLEHVKTLNILGVFSKTQLEQMVPYLNLAKGLEAVRFSTDFTRDLPSNLLEFKGLKKLGMIDNLSLILSQTFHDLAVEKHYINYWDADQKKNVIVPFDYYSDRVSLEDYDFNYLSNLLGKGQMLPYFAYQKTPTAVPKVNVNLAKNRGYGVSEYSYFDTINRADAPTLIFDLNASIQPIKQNLDLGYEHFVINPSVNQILQTKRGFKLTIPAKVLLTLENKECQNFVDVYFKLVDNLAEMALMGIPGVYDSLNSAVRLANPKMILLYASCQNQPLKIKKGYAIDIEVPSSKGRQWQLSTYNSFWYPYNFLDYGPVTRFKKDAFNDTQKLQKLIDFSGLDARYYDPNYYYILDEQDQRVKIPRTLKLNYNVSENARIYLPYKKGMKLDRKELYIKPGKALIGVRRVTFSDTARKRQTYFRIYPKSDKRLFPELKAFKNYVFKYTGSESRKTFTKNLIRKKKFNDIRIFYKPGAREGVVELKYQEGYVQLPFVVVDDKIKKPAHKQTAKFLKRFQKYERLLKKRNEYHLLHLKNYNQKVNAERPDIGVPMILPIIELGTYALAELDSQQALSNINLIVNDVAGLPIDVKQIIVVYKGPQALEYFNSKAIQLNFNREFALLITDYKNNIYFVTASRSLSLKSGEGSVKSINARLLSPEMEIPSVLWKNLGFKRERR